MLAQNQHEIDSEPEKSFKVVGTCTRGEGGKLHCDLEPVDSDYIDSEDFPGEAKPTSEPVGNDEDSNTTEDSDPKEE